MLSRLIALLALAYQSSGTLSPNFTSQAGVEIYKPSSSFNTIGPWSFMSRAGDYIYVAGTSAKIKSNTLWQELYLPPKACAAYTVRTATLAPTGLPRVRKAYENMRDLVEMVGVGLTDCARTVVYTTDVYRYRPMCNEVQIEHWGGDARQYPSRTIVEVDRLNEDDIVEVEGTFYRRQRE